MIKYLIKENEIRKCLWRRIKRILAKKKKGEIEKRNGSYYERDDNNNSRSHSKHVKEELAEGVNVVKGTHLLLFQSFMDHR